MRNEKSATARGTGFGRRWLIAIVVLMSGGFRVTAQQVNVDNTAGIFATADAGFDSTDGCIEAHTALSVFTIKGGDGGTSSPGSLSGGFLFFSLVAYNECTGEYYLGADNATAVGSDQFKVNQAAGTATLVADVPAGNPFTGATATVHINVTWTASSDLLPPEDFFVFTDNVPHSGNFVAQTNGTLVPAVPSGTITDGQVSFSNDPSPVGTLGLARAAFHNQFVQ